MNWLYTQLNFVKQDHAVLTSLLVYNQLKFEQSMETKSEETGVRVAVSSKDTFRKTSTVTDSSTTGVHPCIPQELPISHSIKRIGVYSISICRGGV